MGTKKISSYKAKVDKKRSLSDKIADYITAKAGTITFLFIHIVWFALWMISNSGIIGFIPQFDPAPFSLLTTILSVEAIFLAIVVLISQNREGMIADIREEIDLNVNKISEQEITAIAKMLALLLEKNGIDVSKDPEFKKVLEPINSKLIEKTLEKELD